ncbi:MAG: hypothetical protein KGL39_32155 [Patescibacteria group bacterium]|nr:hypothetical protein [Patescibacteria group bacterium]
MPYQFDVVGWEDFDGNRHDGMPSDLSDVYGQLVHAYDPSTGESEHFWAFVPAPFEDWDDWYDYIDSLMDMYGLATS